MGDDVGVLVRVGGEEEAEGEAAGVGVGVCVGDVLGWELGSASMGVIVVCLFGTYGDAGGGREAGEERGAWGGEVRCAGERRGFGCWRESAA